MVMILGEKKNDFPIYDTDVLAYPRRYQAASSSHLAISHEYSHHVCPSVISHP